VTSDHWVPETELLFKTACGHYDNADYEKAATLFARLLAEDAGVYGSQDTELWLAACYVEQWQWARASMLLERLIEQFHEREEPISYAQAVSLAGRCKLQTGSFQDAERLLAEFEGYAHILLQNDQTWMLYEGRVDRARVQVALGKSEEALKTFDLAESGVPASAMLPVTKTILDYERARALHYLGDHQRAIQILETIDPHLFHDLSRREFWLLLVRCQEWIKEHEKALTAFKTLEALGIPDSLKAEAHHWAGRACYYLGQGSESLRHFQESTKCPSDIHWLAESNVGYLEQLKMAGYE